MTNYNSSGAVPSVDPCSMLGQLRAALYQLMTGQQRAQVRNGDQWLTWHQGNVKELRGEIQRLEFLCGVSVSPNAFRPRAARVVRIGNPSPHRRY